MKHSTRLALPLLLGLSACGYWFTPSGVGFTGIDGEPKVAPDDAGAGVSVSRAASVPASLASIPPVVVRADAETESDLAGAAIPSGGNTSANAVAVGNSGQTLMLSTVEVNGRLFAVLRQPEGETRRMASGAGAAFVSSVPRLTGCLAASGAYSQGGSGDRPKALAVAMDCS